LSSTPVTSTVTLHIASSKQRIVSGNLTIINRVYTSRLSNSSSKEYIEMAKEVNSSVSDTKTTIKSFRLKGETMLTKLYSFSNHI
jgi:hypothetical protein